MKLFTTLIAAIILITACRLDVNTYDGAPPVEVQGTWRLVTATIVQNDTATTTDYTKDKKFIKIINDTHFAFLLHDLNKGADSTALFTAGGGSYTVKDSTYTEKLEFCTDRSWENHDFTFTVTIRNDTLVQKGIEKIEGTNINRLNIETYVRETAR